MILCYLESFYFARKKNSSNVKGLKLKISIFKKQSIRFIIIIFRN